MGNIARLPCDEAAILAGSCEHPVTTNGPWILAATILGSSMVFIDGTVVNVALPALQSALHATLADVQWVMESYALFLGAYCKRWQKDCRLFRQPYQAPQKGRAFQHGGFRNAGRWALGLAGMEDLAARWRRVMA